MIFGLSAFLLYFFTAEAISQKGNPEELAEVAESMNLSTKATVGVLSKKINDLSHAFTSLHIIVDFFLVSSALIFLNVSLAKILKGWKMEAQTSDLNNANTVETLNNSLLQLELTMANGGILTISQFLYLVANIMVVST